VNEREQRILELAEKYHTAMAKLDAAFNEMCEYDSYTTAYNAAKQDYNQLAIMAEHAKVMLLTYIHVTT